ncbi:hypothetical protein [Pseudobutyrivibrio sp.]
MKKEPIDLIREAQAEIEKITQEDINNLSLEEAKEFKQLTSQILFQIDELKKHVQSS